MGMVLCASKGDISGVSSEIIVHHHPEYGAVGIIQLRPIADGRLHLSLHGGFPEVIRGDGYDRVAALTRLNQIHDLNVSPAVQLEYKDLSQEAPAESLMRKLITLI